MVKAGAVHPLAGGAVRLGDVKSYLTAVAHHAGNGFRQLGNGEVLPKANVDVAEHGLGVLRIGGLRQLHDVHAGGGHVVDIQKLALGGAGAPDGHAWGAVDFGFVKAADQRGDDVRIFGVVVVARAVQVGGHDATVVHSMAGTVLAVVAFAEFDASDFGNGVGLVGGLQGAGEQGVFTHGLRG